MRPEDAIKPTDEKRGEKNVRTKKRDVLKFKIMKHIEEIVEITKDSKLSAEAIKLCEPHTKMLAEKLSLTEMQTLLLSIFVDQCYDESIQTADLALHFNCRNVSLLCYSDDINSLVKKGYIKRLRQTIYNRMISYRVPSDVITSLENNIPYSTPSIEGIGIHCFFDYLQKLFEANEVEKLRIDELSNTIMELVQNNPALQICKAISLYDLKEDDKYGVTLALYFCHRLINENDDSIGFYDIEQIFDFKIDFRRIETAIKRGSHELIYKEVIKSKKNNDLLSKGYYCLTDKAKEELLSELDIEFKKEKKLEDVIYYGEIGLKPLFYNPSEQRQIDQLTKLLDEENFVNVQNRLAESGMRKGFACLFYGSPGTGKTETVYQIARQTGRDILIVNISEIKSMWVGASEKNIQALFNRYRNLTKCSPKVPILLFNEADAVLGKRKEEAERAVDKMENSIQNIILQEMESLDGIMIATTNLTQSLDKAFERRFLFKVEFSKPNLDAKQAIWKSMMPTLSKSEVNELALAYDFSGGQIENIARKQTIETIINGEEPSLETLHSFCRAEQLQKSSTRNRIGFISME